ncbi:interferon-induced GTP-binding protein Mx2-like [Octodon degus]|uniref:Interferon-induced GTP-binding protein Mx2-like n=1 Tax=Octodon degus TaxID=10160 RepID=A0A6P6ER51_OCTDE|nr:interferon-induced GTP-binding protein Mx2-like [Octodon degus]
MGEAQRDSAAPSNHLQLSGDAYNPEKAQALVSENNLCVQYEERVRPCIDLIDSLRALGVEQDLALPAIAVIGDQSSGKSSVLEALSGVALPRGSGIVTRCPLVLKLKKLRQDEEWRGKVSYLGFEEDILDVSKVEEEILKAQNIIAGDGLGIKDELISLEIGSPSVPDLTLIDLPGITRVPVGNQPADIGHQIKRLIRKYIAKEATINLVVVPSNVDIATTEALSMAQEMDPEGDRTIGILTKPDLVDRGTEDKVVDVVQNLVCHLKKGYMIVKCRGQQDIQECLSLAEALQRERTFFEDHPHFRVLLEDRKATVPCLAERLSEELIAHICKSLPLLENQIKDLHEKTAEELQKFGLDIPEDDSEKTFFLIEKINAFNQDISALVEGEENVGAEGTRLFARLRKGFLWWSSKIKEHFAKGYDGLHHEICKFENQHRGRELPGFVNFRTFEKIIKRQLQALEEPALDMLHVLTNTVRKAFTDASERNFTEFFNLYRITKNKIEDIRLSQEEAAEKAIHVYFQMEKLVYCQDQAYRDALQKVREEEGEKEKKSKGSQASTSNAMAEILQHLKAYSQEVHSRISTHIPLIIQYYVLQLFGQHLQNAMLQLLQDKESCAWLLKEKSDTSEKRKFLKERLARLGQARRKLAKFPC